MREGWGWAKSATTGSSRAAACCAFPSRSNARAKPTVAASMADPSAVERASASRKRVRPGLSAAGSDGGSAERQRTLECLSGLVAAIVIEQPSTAPQPRRRVRWIQLERSFQVAERSLLSAGFRQQQRAQIGPAPIVRVQFLRLRVAGEGRIRKAVGVVGHRQAATHGARCRQRLRRSHPLRQEGGKRRLGGIQPLHHQRIVLLRTPRHRGCARQRNRAYERCGATADKRRAHSLGGCV